MSNVLKTLHVNPELSSLLIAHFHDFEMISKKIAPILPMRSEDGFYFKFDKAQSLSVQTQERQPGTHFPVKDLGLSKQNVLLKQYGLAMFCTDEELATQQSPINVEKAKIKPLSRDIAAHRELEFFTKLNTTSWENSTQDGSGADFVQWDQASANPLANLEDWMRDIFINCGRMPNKVVMAHNVWTKIKQDPKFLAYFQNRAGETSKLTPEYVGNLLSSPGNQVSVEVPTLVYNSAATNLTANLTEAFNNRIWLGYSDTNATQYDKTSIVMPSWTKFDKAKDIGSPAVMKMRDDATLSWKYMVQSYFTFEVPALDMGRNIINVLATP